MTLSLKAARDRAALHQEALDARPLVVTDWALEDDLGFGFYVGPAEWARGGVVSPGLEPEDPLLLLVDKATGQVMPTVYLAVAERVDAMRRRGPWPVAEAARGGIRLL